MADLKARWLDLIDEYSGESEQSIADSVQPIAPIETLPTVKLPPPANEQKSTGFVEVVDTEYNDDDLPIYKTEKGNLSFWCRLPPPQSALWQIAQYDIQYCGRLFDYREFSLGFDPVGRKVIFRLSAMEYYALQCNEAGQIIDGNQFIRTLGRVHNIQGQLPPCFSGEIRLIIRRPADDVQNPEEG